MFSEEPFVRTCEEIDCIHKIYLLLKQHWIAHDLHHLRSCFLPHMKHPKNR